MIKSRLYAVPIAAMLLMFASWLLLAGTNELGAGPNITPTIIVTARHFLPVIYGIEPLYTPTPTLPPPTVTPWASLTPTTTPEFELPHPTLYAINNADGDGNYTVAWSAVQGATRYFLKENFNNTSWEILYDGPGLSINRINMPPGVYCYNVRAYGPAGRSAWAGEQCTTVEEPPGPEYVCEFDTLFEGPRKGTDVELLHDGRVFITQTSETGASIFDPSTRTFQSVDLPQGGGPYAAVLDDGDVVLTVGGDDPHSMVYHPETGEITRLDILVNCLENYSNYDPYYDRALVTYCGGNQGYVYHYLDYGDEYIDQFSVDIEPAGPHPAAYIVQVEYYRGTNIMLVTNGLAGDKVYIWADQVGIDTEKIFDYRESFILPYESASTMTVDKDKILISGGVDRDYFETFRESYESNLDEKSFTQIADMPTARGGHALVSLTDGNRIAIGGSSAFQEDTVPSDFSRTVEIYDSTTEQWFAASPLNIGRYQPLAVQLLNGEIFIYGGQTNPGPGYGTTAPIEIGTCYLTN